MYEYRSVSHLSGILQMLQGNAASEAELTSVGQLDVAMQFQQAAGRTDALMQMCSYERRTELGNHAEAAEACRGLKHDKKGENYRY